jgi:hypothetical protein
MRQVWPIYAWTVVLVMLSIGVGVKYSRDYPPPLTRDFSTRMSDMFYQHTQPGVPTWLDRVVRSPFS